MGNHGNGKGNVATAARLDGASASQGPRMVDPGPQPARPETEGMSEEQETAAWAEHNRAYARWSNAMGRALSLGVVSQAQAEERRWRGDSTTSKWEPLPHDLYHVTTAADAVRASRLLTRDELAQEYGLGLGGGPRNTISFTHNKATADGIRAAILEMRDVALGKVTVRDMLARADSGSDATHPYGEAARGYWQPGWKQGDPEPPGLQALLDGLKSAYIGGLGTAKEAAQRYGGAGWRPAPGAEVGKLGDGTVVAPVWQRPATETEQRNSAIDAYKMFTAYREHAGGALDPLFFISDAAGLANVDPAQIQVMHFHPIDGAMGYQVSALGEWRTMSGEAVRLAGNGK
jgi:hypothetical protein